MTTELARVETDGALSVAQVGARLDAIVSLMREKMVEGVDYGTIPGTNDKPTLLKPGAEKLGMMFRLEPDPDTVKTYHPDNHLTVETRCRLKHIDTGVVLGAASAMCTTRESKYAWRGGARVCPECGKPTIKKSKFPPRDDPDSPPGFYCFGKLGGCGVNFAHDDERITSQPEGRVPNPDLPDCYNTVLRISEKRAFVAVVRQVTGASAIFDEERPEVEDDAEVHAPPAKPAGKPAQQPQKPATQPQQNINSPAGQFVARVQATEDELRKRQLCTDGEYVLAVINESVMSGFGPNLYNLTAQQLKVMDPLAEAKAKEFYARKTAHRATPVAAAAGDAFEGTPPAQATPAAAAGNASVDQIKRIGELLHYVHGPAAAEMGPKRLARMGKSRWELLTAAEAEKVIAKLEGECERFDAAARAAVDAAEAGNVVYDAEYVDA